MRGERILILIKVLLCIFAVIAALESWAIRKLLIKTTDSVRQREIKIEKFKMQTKVLIQWINLKNSGRDISEYFLRRGYKRIAIYGMADLGSILFDELKEGPVEVLYVVDRGMTSDFIKTKMIALEEDFPEVDAIVVTPIESYEGIKKSIVQKVDCPILPLDEVIFSI